MIIKYAPEIRDEVEMCMMIKDSIDDEKVSWQKQFDRLTCFLCEEQTMWRRWQFCVKFDFYVGITIMVHINRIREKIEDDSKNSKILETVWGAGYRLSK